MPFDRFSMLRGIKGVEREFLAVRFAMTRLLGMIERDPTELAGDLRIRDVQAASAHLEMTYFIRLFAEFDGSLRSFWRSAVRETSPVAEVLLNQVAARRQVPADLCEQAHQVRLFRNQLVHGGERAEREIRLPAARGILCHYLSFLPIEWS